MRALATAIVAALLAFAAAPANAQAVIGSVTRVAGEAEGTLEGASRTLAAGLPVHLNEEIATGKDARLELTLDDGTKLTVGENAEIALDEFVYAPGGARTFAASVTGAFRYISGVLAPGETRDCTIVTPAAVIGVRGTDFWGGPIDGAFGVFLIEGEIAVTAGGVDVAVSASGTGVTIPSAGAPPGEVFLWEQDRIDRAIATVTFP